MVIIFAGYRRVVYFTLIGLLAGRYFSFFILLSSIPATFRYRRAPLPRHCRFARAFALPGAPSRARVAADAHGRRRIADILPLGRAPKREVAPRPDIDHACLAAGLATARRDAMPPHNAAEMRVRCGREAAAEAARRAAALYSFAVAGREHTRQLSKCRRDTRT